MLKLSAMMLPKDTDFIIINLVQQCAGKYMAWRKTKNHLLTATVSTNFSGIRTGGQITPRWTWLSKKQMIPIYLITTLIFIPQNFLPHIYISNCP